MIQTQFKEEISDHISRSKTNIKEHKKGKYKLNIVALLATKLIKR